MLDGIIEELIAGLFIAALWWLYRFFGFWGLVWPWPFWRGWLAENRGEETCPYKIGSMEARAWKSGWKKSREMEPGD